ncbi:MAG: Trp biosynthesis-associated membrane protein [Actinomycetota bacterium]|nr:Trp biosynthesis-associated membrane protein [Actinomycetota bacterium]
MTRRPHRELAAACLLTLAGAVAVLLAGGRRWVAGRPPGAAVTGNQLLPPAHALALVALAGVVALLAARRRPRTAVGAALLLAGVVIAGSAAGRLGDSTPGWPILTMAGGLLVAGAGALTMARGRAWPALGARYDAPVDPRPPAESDAWDALDRGEDPTTAQPGSGH